MAEKIPGCHHCIGTAFTVTNLVFNFIHTHAVAHDGLSPAEISDLRKRFLENYSSGFDFFEGIHRECMAASRDAKTDPLSRDMLLPSLLAACAKRSAQSAFKVEIGVYGVEWLDQFFFALAVYIREHVRRDAEPKLIAAFVDAAGKYKSSLTVAKLLQEPKTQEIMEICLVDLTSPDDREAKSALISATVNDHVAKAWAIAGADPAKTTTNEILEFLKMLRNEAALLVRSGVLLTRLR